MAKSKKTIFAMAINAPHGSIDTKTLQNVTEKYLPPKSYLMKGGKKDPQYLGFAYASVLSRRDDIMKYGFKLPSRFAELQVLALSTLRANSKATLGLAIYCKNADLGQNMFGHFECRALLMAREDRNPLDWALNWRPFVAEALVPWPPESPSSAAREAWGKQAESTLGFIVGNVVQRWKQWAKENA